MAVIENPTTNSILDGLLYAASEKWGISQDQIQENMDKIAYHESKGNPSAIQSVGPVGTAMDGEPAFDVGKGRGLFQFEKGEGQGAHTALNRLATILEHGVNVNGETLGAGETAPDWMSGLAEKDYDVSALSSGQQQMLVLANLLGKPNVEGRTPASWAGIDTDEKLAKNWAQHHQAGTEPGSDEEKDMMSKFLEDLNWGYRHKEILP